MNRNLCGLAVLLSCAVSPLAGSSPGAQVTGVGTSARIPIVLDTDIGGDIDDAFALALVTRIRRLDLLAVTTVSGDTRARARIAAKLLAVAGFDKVPVAAGAPGPGEPFAQSQWAENFTSPSLVAESAIDLLRDKVHAGQGKTVVVAIGALTNVAGLLRRYPEEKKNIREIVLMGGSLAQGYSFGSGAIAESNIASDAPSAQVVFSSGVPISMAPLDATAHLQMQPPQLNQLFAHETPLTDALQALYRLWGKPVPTLHDALPIGLLIDPGLCQKARMDIVVSKDGWTRSAQGPVNATVAVHCDPTKFIDFYGALFSSQASAAGQS